MSKLHIKKGDTVYVNAGEDKGKTSCTERVGKRATCYRRRYQYGLQEYQT